MNAGAGFSGKNSFWERREGNTKVAVKAAEPQVLTVTGVAAADATTLTVTGTKLGDLTAADIKVTPAVGVASYTAAENGKTATVKLSAGLQSGTEYTVTVNGTDFKVKYTAGEITSVAVTETAYDNDTPGQQIAITVNGGSPITVNDLVADGYFVEFSVTSKGAADNNFFANATASNRSTTGILTSAAIAEGDYQVQVVLTKGSSIITSPLATVKIINLDATATGVEDIVLEGRDGVGASTFIEGVKLTGKTLVATEKVVLTGAAVNTASGKVTLPSTPTGVGKVTVTSDNTSVIQAAKNTNGEVEISAIAPGTATLTFTYGSVKTTAAYTVVNVDRHPATAVAENSTVRVIKGVDPITTNVIVKDQYGELVNGLSFGTNAKIYSSNENVATAASLATTGTNGKAIVSVAGINAGTAYMMFSYLDNNSNKVAYTAATIAVSVEQVANAAKNKLVATKAASDPASYSNDLTIDTYDKKDSKVKIKLETYNVNDALVSGASFMGANYYFKYNAAVVSLSATATDWTQSKDSDVGYNRATTTTGSAEFELQAKAKGVTTLALYDDKGVLVAQTTITVEDTTPYLTAVTFNSACPTSLTVSGQALNYTDVFNITASAGDPVITGITVAQPYGQLRIDKGTVTEGAIYIDITGDGAYNVGEDTFIGTIEVTGDSTVQNNPITKAYAVPNVTTKKTITYKVKDITGKVIAAKAVEVAG